MNLRRKRLSGCRLYLILDTGVVPYPGLLSVCKEAVQSGVDIIQLRDKVGTTKDMLTFISKARHWSRGRVLFIVNDRIDVAFAAQADGVHLGQEDLPVSVARRLLGSRAIIGRSCQSMAHLRGAVREGADYVGFGSVFKTLTKPGRQPMARGLLSRASRFAEGSGLPLFAIGGITRRNMVEVLACGAGRVAVCRDILLANDVGVSVWEWRKALTSLINRNMMRE